jgi:cysteine desulfurase/selenocysteine lyase
MTKDSNITATTRSPHPTPQPRLTPGLAARAEFPFFIEGPGGCYLDSAATTQKPRQVLDTLIDVLVNTNANVHRGAYRLSAVASERYDDARGKIARYIGARSESSIVFVRGATEAINLVAYGSADLFNPGDVILLSLLEHHSNIVPWQLLAKRRGLRIEFVDILDDGSLDLDDMRVKVAALKPKLVAVTQLANSLGSVTPIADVVSIVKSYGAKVLVDGAQGAAHLGVDVEALGCDYYVFSGHKLYGPTGIGVLYAKPERLEEMQPFQGGGDMISYVSVEGSGWAEIPQRFEAGTPAFPEAIALGAAVDFVQRFNREELIQHERALISEAMAILREEPGITLYGPATVGKEQLAVVSFAIDCVHPHDFATIADTHNVQIRAGNHCAMPTLRRLGVQATVRMSFGVYSSIEDLGAIRDAIREARAMFS